MDRTVCSSGRKSGINDADLARANILEQESDAELVRLLVAGNHDVMALIFDRYYRIHSVSEKDLASATVSGVASSASGR